MKLLLEFSGTFYSVHFFKLFPLNLMVDLQLISIKSLICPILTVLKPSWYLCIDIV